MFTCYMCGSHDISLKTKDHFIPKSVAKKYGIRSNIMLPCCSDCNNRRRNAIVFPPFDNYSWIKGVPYKIKKKLISIFYNYIMIRIGKNICVKYMKSDKEEKCIEPIFYEWLDDYRKWCNNDYKPIESKFNKKMYVIKV